MMSSRSILGSGRCRQYAFLTQRYCQMVQQSWPQLAEQNQKSNITMRQMGTWPKVRPVRVKIITMDVTGTIVSFLGTLEDHYVGAAEKSGIHPDKLHKLKYDDPKIIDRAFSTAYKECCQQYPCFGGDQLTAKEWWKICVTRSFELAGVSMTETQQDMVFQRIYSTFGSHAAYSAFADAKPFLRWAHRSGVVTGVLSNADERYGDSILPMLGITLDEVQFTCFSKDYKIEKPDSRFFHAAIDAAMPWMKLKREKYEQQHQLKIQDQQQQQQHLQGNNNGRISALGDGGSYTIAGDTNSNIICHPSEVLHIGNDFVKDFEGARRAGMHCVLLDRYGEEEKAAEWRRRGAPVFKDLLDVVEFLGRAGCHLGE